MHLEDWLTPYNNLTLLWFVIASAVACTLGNSFVKLMLRYLSAMAVEKKGDTTYQKRRDEIDKLIAEFDPKFASIVGNLERVLYIFSVMRGELALAAGWLVLKAFFPWNYIEDPPDRHVLAERMKRYHIYIL